MLFLPASRCGAPLSSEDHADAAALRPASAVSVSSYTANLASFFTAQNFEVLGPSDMTALQSSTACMPAHANDEAHLATTSTELGVGALMGGLVTAFMPADFANKTNEEKTACCWSATPHEMISRCADKVRARRRRRRWRPWRRARRG